ncbi:MAG: DUF2520 domain-containing protein [Gammaproteobacteria bacterium]|nr:DUF2520 domain-containing protein [Gammaproteobacteria bacterium]
MRQVPSEYVVIGSGRMATHFCHYLHLLHIPFRQWSRRNNSSVELKTLSTNCSRVLLLIKDAEIINFWESNPILHKKTCVHFSGSLLATNIFSAHPLMTFGQSLYEFEDYKKIPFILETPGPDFAELLPGLPNSNFKIPRELKVFYHALCVLSGNFTCIFWQKFFYELQHTFKIPAEIAYPYLEQITKNIVSNPNQALTGPLTRNDQKTIAANKAALKNDPFYDVYEAVTKLFPSREKNI